MMCLWAGPEGPPPEQPELIRDPFGNTNYVPERFVGEQRVTHKAKAQHPCYTTSAHELGIKAPSQVDMPVKWRGKEGTFTRGYEMSEPGNTAVTVNNYVNRSLRTNKTVSKVHKDFDVDW